MRTRLRWIVLVVLGAAAVATVGVLAGRDTAHGKEYDTGRLDGYFDGLRVGAAQGRRDGRVVQEGSSLPPGKRAAVEKAFRDGYTAGADDVFAGYDGGWTLGASYEVVIEAGSGDIAYRIRSREPLKPGRDYYLCAAAGGLCSKPAR